MTRQEAIDTRALLDQARVVQNDLERLRSRLENSHLGPYTKSVLSREVGESQARVDGVVRQCIQDLATAPAA